MLEDHVKYPILRRRLRAGPAADYVDGFADWLHHLGYKPSSIEHTLRALADWADWLGQAGFAVIDAFQVLDVYKSLLAQPDRDSHVRGRDQRSLTAANRFIRFLQERGVLPCLGRAPTPAERWPIIGEFRAWMQQQRGLRESSLNTYERVLIDLLRELGETPLSYSANQVRNFVLKRAMPHGISRAKSTVTATRAFLRFLAATGRCPVGLDHAIPGYLRFVEIVHRATLSRTCGCPMRARCVRSQGREGAARPRRFAPARASWSARRRGRRLDVSRHRLGKREDRGVRQGTPPGVAPAPAGGW